MMVIDKYVPAKDQKALQALAAALLHDVGHGPFSHAFEKIGERFDLKMAHHETVSDALIATAKSRRSYVRWAAASRTTWPTL